MYNGCTASAPRLCVAQRDPPCTNSTRTRRWIQLTGGGDSPGRRLRHNMRSDGSVIYLTGGYTYDEGTQARGRVRVRVRVQQGRVRVRA